MLSHHTIQPSHTPISTRIRAIIPRVSPTAPGRGFAKNENRPLAETLRLMGAVMSYPRNTEIFGENESADYVHKVISGSVRTYKILSDGRRQIAGFYLPGDVFGLELGETYSFSAEAISDATVLVVRRSAVTSLAARETGIAAELFELCTAELRRMRNASCCWSRARRSGWRASFWEWPGAGAQMSSSCRCRARTSPIISGSPSKRYRGPSPASRVRQRSK